MSLKTLDHSRATAAVRAVQERFKTLVDPAAGPPPGAASLKAFKEYRSVALQSSVYLRQLGLLQVVAFWMTKERNAEKAVLTDLFGWLTSNELPHLRSVCIGGASRTAIPADAKLPGTLARALTQRSSVEIALLEAESSAYLDWLRRIVEGVHRGLPKGVAPAAGANVENAGQPAK